MSERASDLDAAYVLRSPEDCLRFYQDFAASYDAGFAAGMEYRLPAHVAGAFTAANGVGPVLDVGAGTGLLVEALRGLGFQGAADGIDISPGMLDRAREKGIYRNLLEADVTAALPFAAESFGGVVSSGTFTQGHVGPEALGPLLQVANQGAVFALSINTRVYLSLGFDVALADLGDRISGLQLIEVPIYGASAAQYDPAHAGDRAQIALFRKA